MQGKMLVLIAALAAVSQAYTVGRYTNSTCLANLGTTTVATSTGTGACTAIAGVGAASSVQLPNSNCPVGGFMHANFYPDLTCTGTATSQWVSSGTCTAVGAAPNTNYYTVTCLASDSTTTTTEMPWGLPWWFWLLLYCLVCCCCALCGGGGAIPFLGGKKKPTKKPAPVSQPSVVEEVVTVEDEAAPMMTSGYPTASMAVPMASTGYAGYPTASMAVPMASYPQAY